MMNYKAGDKVMFEDKECKVEEVERQGGATLLRLWYTGPLFDTEDTTLEERIAEGGFSKVVELTEYNKDTVKLIED